MTGRFPLEPLAALTRLDQGELARVAGVSRRTVCRWKALGMNQWIADRLAIALGYHPAVVWPEWYGR